jgi:hypothetical protein
MGRHAYVERLTFIDLRTARRCATFCTPVPYSRRNNSLHFFTEIISHDTVSDRWSVTRMTNNVGTLSSALAIHAA